VGHAALVGRRDLAVERRDVMMSRVPRLCGNGIRWTDSNYEDRTKLGRAGMTVCMGDGRLIHRKANKTCAGAESIGLTPRKLASSSRPTVEHLRGGKHRALSDPDHVHLGILPRVRAPLAGMDQDGQALGLLS
jgi:hypothetical protein